MEGCLHHIQRIIRTDYHVLWIIKLPRHLLEIHERFIQRHDS